MGPEEVNKDVKGTKLGPVLGIRHVQTLMLCLAMAICYAMRVNMSLAIVAMTDSTEEKHFDWSVKTQSVILSSFFWGYIVLQIPGGMLAARFGGKILLLITITVNSVVSLLLPAGAYYGGWYVVCACRVLQGLSQGFLFPSTHNLLGKWAPVEEKSRLGTLAYSGCQIGMALQNLSSGFVASAWGWPAIFYVNGALGAVWVALYVFLGADSPENSRMIRKEEKDYVQSSLGHVGEQKKYKTPWKSIWTSIPFLALMLVHGGQNWGFFTMMTLIPTYMANVLGADIKQDSMKQVYVKDIPSENEYRLDEMLNMNGVLSALPYLAVYAMSFPVGFSADWILKKKLLSITNTRKLFNSIGLYGAGLALIGLSYTPSGQVTMAVILLMVVVGINAGHYAGYLLVHIDMAPNFAGTLMGITNCFANIISLIAPLAAGAMINDEANPTEWRKVFFVASAIYIASNTVFVVFGSCETQKWNEPENEECNEEKTEKQV